MYVFVCMWVLEFYYIFFEFPKFCTHTRCSPFTLTIYPFRLNWNLESSKCRHKDRGHRPPATAAHTTTATAPTQTTNTIIITKYLQKCGKWKCQWTNASESESLGSAKKKKPHNYANACKFLIAAPHSYAVSHRSRAVVKIFLRHKMYVCVWQLVRLSKLEIHIFLNCHSTGCY